MFIHRCIASHHQLLTENAYGALRIGPLPAAAVVRTKPVSQASRTNLRRNKTMPNPAKPANITQVEGSGMADGV